MLLLPLTGCGGEGVTADDAANTVTIVTSKPYANLPGQLAHPTMAILDDAAVLIDGYYNSSMIYSKNVGHAHIHTADYYWRSTEITPADSSHSSLIRGITFLGCAMPNFWVGLLLMLLLCVRFCVFPVISSAGDFKSLFLPALTLAIAMAAKYTRQVRTAVLEELSQDYVIGAEARGIKRSRIIWANVFPNALLPLITMLGLSVGSLLGGTSVVEVIFSYPGLGNLAVSAITSCDYNLIQGYVLWMSLIYMVINLIVDASYVYIDPRMRLKE